MSFQEAQPYLSDDLVRFMVGRGTDADREPIGALVSEVKWGPAIIAAGCYMEAAWPDRPEIFRDDALLLVNLLAVTHGLPVVSTGTQTQVVNRQIAHLVGLAPPSSPMFRDIPGFNTSNVVPHTTPAVSEDKLSECVQLFSEMPKGDVILRMALSRLASALSRTGMHAALDKIIDVAIALEIMYQLDGSRGIGSQLFRRARDLVGQGREDKNWVRRTAESIYRIRGDIVHGRLPADTAQAYLDGLDLAHRTLVHPVRWGRPSEW